MGYVVLVQRDNSELGHVEAFVWLFDSIASYMTNAYQIVLNATSSLDAAKRPALWRLKGHARNVKLRRDGCRWDEEA